MGEAVVNGVRVSYDVRGEGPPVVLVPGRGFPRVWWTEEDHVRPYLDAGFAVLRFDNRGMPPSDCPPEPFGIADLVADLAGLLDELGIRDARLVGYSMGSLVAQELAAARPDLVRALVLAGSLARQLAWHDALNRGALELFATGVEIPAEFWVGMLFGQLHDPDALLDDEAVAAWIGELVALPPWEDPGRSGQWRAYAEYRADPRALARVRAPALVVGFERDLLMPPALVREVADAIPGARYLEIPRAGHWGLVTAPASVHGPAVAFLREAES